MVDINSTDQTQAPVTPLPRRCFYCARPIGEDEDRVEGVAAVAHRSCVHEQVVARLKTVYPTRPASLDSHRNTHGASLTRRFLREAGVTEKELWG